MKRGIVTAVLVFICFILQTSVFELIKLAGITPNILLILISSVAVMRGQKPGMIVGFFSGFCPRITATEEIRISKIFGVIPANLINSNTDVCNIKQINTSTAVTIPRFIINPFLHKWRKEKYLYDTLISA